MPLIGGALSYSSRHYVATGYSAGHRTSIAPLGIGDIAAIYDFYTLCNVILKEEDKHWDAKATLKLAYALRGGSILFGSFLPDNQFGATNTTLNVARDYLIRQTNNENQATCQYIKARFSEENRAKKIDVSLIIPYRPWVQQAAWPFCACWGAYGARS